MSRCSARTAMRLGNTGEGCRMPPRPCEVETDLFIDQKGSTIGQEATCFQCTTLPRQRAKVLLKDSVSQALSPSHTPGLTEKLTLATSTSDS